MSDTQKPNDKYDMLRQVLGVTLGQNLAFMKERFPHLYHHFHSYSPEGFALEIDQNGRLNLAGREGFVYADDPRTTSIAQAEMFLECPVKTVYRVDMGGFDAAAKHFKHPVFLKKIAENGNRIIEEELKSNVKYERLDRYPLVTLVGIGMGYHLEHLADKEIDHLFVYEPNKDLFYASLHIIDYRMLVEKFTQQNRGITLVVGATAEKFTRGLHKTMLKLGSYRTGVMPIYRHYNSEKTDEIFKRYYDNMSNFYSGFGFFEDEVVSTKHTLENLKNNHRIFRNDISIPEKLRDKPVFVCANGPSLDKAISFLKENRDKLLLFSCGTTLMSLHKAGIKPDLHFEIERMDIVANWLKAIGDDDYLSDIRLVCMNTVSEKVISLFKDAYIFFKPNDAGNELIRVTMSEKYRQCLMMFGSNPTCTNGAVAFLHYANFKSWYLVGTDFGFRDQSFHHSKESAYFKNFKGVFEGGGNDAKKKRPGNFGGEVLTTGIFDWARHSTEYVIQRAIDSKQDFTCYNTADGALIEHAVPLELDHCQLKENIDFSYFEEWLEKSSHQKLFSERELDKVLKRQRRKLLCLIDELIDERFREVSCTPRQFIDICISHQSKFSKLEGGEGNYLIQMVKGSMNYLETLIIGYTYSIKLESNREEFLKNSINIMIDYFSEMKVIFKENTENFH